MSTIESSVTRLLVSTKHLLESLTLWARQEEDDKFVSDAYVKLGNDFRAAAKAFTNAGVDISDVGDVPKALRIVLESALSEAPTQENLDRFLPNIRKIIVNLLLNLKVKQTRAKELASELNTQQSQRNSSGGVSDVNSSVKETKKPSVSKKSKLLNELQLKSQAQPNDILQEQVSETPVSDSSEALAKLQKGNVILRRASKRFSAYQFAKLTNFNTSQLPRISTELKIPHSSDAIDSAHDVPVNKATDSPQKDDTYIFLRLDDQTKKIRVDLPLSLATLRLLFVEKFAYSPGSSTFPDIYILDPQTGVSFELEESYIENEIKHGSLLLLNKASIDANYEKLKLLESRFENLDLKLDDAVSKIISQVGDFISPKSLNSAVSLSSNVDDLSQGSKAKDLTYFKELQSLHTEMNSLKMAQSSRNKTIRESMSKFCSELRVLKEKFLEESSSGSNRTFMDESYAKLSEDSDSLLTRVDDLQDMMEALRKDVAQRGVRLGPKQLKTTNREIEEAKFLLDSLCNYIREGKPTWKKVWESELDKVCEEQQFFNLQDDLTRDLDEDIKKIKETFDLIERCSLEQSKQTVRKNAFSNRINVTEPGESILNVRDAVLQEVAVLVPDHDMRLDAIAKAEKAREKERQTMEVSPFQEELGEFVGDNKLKKSGGIEEVEKKRQLKDAENFKSSFGLV